MILRNFVMLWPLILEVVQQNIPRLSATYRQHSLFLFSLRFLSIIFFCTHTRAYTLHTQHSQTGKHTAHTQTHIHTESPLRRHSTLSLFALYPRRKHRHTHIYTTQNERSHPAPSLSPLPPLSSDHGLR